jgi:hypothetical protein
MNLGLFDRFENHVFLAILVVNMGESRFSIMNGRTYAKPSFMDDSSVPNINFNFRSFSVLAEGFAPIIIIIDVNRLWCLIFDI